MFLSIIIPVYNTEKYLAECLDSCLNQDIPHADYEIICVNDGSKDGSAAILEDYAARYPNIRVLHQENGGVSKARNNGLRHAVGDYVWFVDSDDFIEVNILAQFRDIAQQAAYDRFTFPIYEFFDCLSQEEVGLKRTRALPPNYQYGDSVMVTSLFRRAFLLQNNLFFRSKKMNQIDSTPILCGEDTLFMYECKRHLNGQSAISDTPVYYYRRNSASATKCFTPEAMCGKMFSFFHMALVVKEDYDKQRFPHASSIEDTANLLMEFLRKGLAYLAQMPWQTFHQALRWLKAQGLFPFKQPPECTYTWQECANEPSGTGKLRNIFRYYSIHPVGLFLAAFPYRLQRMKIRLSRTLRKNPIMNAAMDLKNKILRR